MTYQDFKHAVEVFQLGDRASLAQIRARHRDLVKTYHPDRHLTTDPEAIREVNRAYETLLTYCKDYQYCFSEAEFLEQTPAERLRRQFGWG